MLQKASVQPKVSPLRSDARSNFLRKFRRFARNLRLSSVFDMMVVDNVCLHFEIDSWSSDAFDILVSHTDNSIDSHSQFVVCIPDRRLESVLSLRFAPSLSSSILRRGSIGDDCERRYYRHWNFNRSFYRWRQYRRYFDWNSRCCSPPRLFMLFAPVEWQLIADRANKELKEPFLRTSAHSSHFPLRLTPEISLFKQTE